MLPIDTDQIWQEVVGSDMGLQDWCILLGYRGSMAHGMYVPNTDPDSIDDIDLMGVCVLPLDYYFGLKEYGSRGTREITRDPFDVVIYEVRKMIRLLAQGNPNVLSLLWLDNYMRITQAGRMLVENRHLFMCKNIYNSFIGYAHSQLQRMTRFEHKGYMGEKRKQLVEKHGFDARNASHLIRLLKMGIEALDTGELIVRRPDAEELLAIKRGEWSLEKVQSEAEVLFDACRAAKGQSPLPDSPDRDAINKLCVKVIIAASDREDIHE